MKHTAINLGVVKTIANALGSLNEQVVYVGGAVVSLYINDPAANEVRPTKDVDISVSVSSLVELEDLREELIKRGFYQSAEDDVICRFRYQDILVDVMSTRPVGWAPSNQWFAPGFLYKEYVNINGKQIAILPLPYYLATKLSAFFDRGASDARMSHDMEDITYILDNRIDLVEVIRNAPQDVRTYLKTAFTIISTDHLIREAILGNLYYETQNVRFEQIMEKLTEFVNMT